MNELVASDHCEDAVREQKEKAFEAAVVSHPPRLSVCLVAISSTLTKNSTLMPFRDAGCGTAYYGPKVDMSGGNNPLDKPSSSRAAATASLASKKKAKKHKNQTKDHRQTGQGKTDQQQQQQLQSPQWRQQQFKFPPKENKGSKGIKKSG